MPIENLDRSDLSRGWPDGQRVDGHCAGSLVIHGRREGGGHDLSLPSVAVQTRVMQIRAGKFRYEPHPNFLLANQGE